MYQHLLHFLNLLLLHNWINLIHLSVFLLRFRFLILFIHLYYYVFFIIPNVNTQFSPYYFFNPKLFLICFLQFFFVKCSNYFFDFKTTNKTCPEHSVFNFLIEVTSSDQFGTWAFAKMFIYFDILTNQL